MQAWREFSLDYRYHGTPYHITVRRADAPQNQSVTLDGVRQPDDSIPLVDDHEQHAVEVVVGTRQRPAALPSPAGSNGNPAEAASPQPTAGA